MTETGIVLFMDFIDDKMNVEHIFKYHSAS